MFSGNIQAPRMMPASRPMSGAPNNIQPGMRPMAMPTPQPGMGAPQPMGMPAPGVAMPAPQPGMSMGRPQMYAQALRGQGALA